MTFPVPANPSGMWRRRGIGQRYRSPVPQSAYQTVQTVPLIRTGQAMVAGGQAIVTMGPTGVGFKWYPSSASFSTSTGVADGSQVVMYAGFIAQSQLVDARVYNGGGDTAGLSVPVMVPGDLLIAVWAGAHNGDIAQMTLTGTQDALVT